ncbi:MAG: protein kinase family protein [Lentisphaeria bacterium]|nr:protein kinase family protein [Lentisphaeria bacterium]
MLHKDRTAEVGNAPVGAPPSCEELLRTSEEDLIARGRLLHSAGSITNADTYLLASSFGPCVLKTFRRRWWCARVLFTRWTLRREAAAMRRLEGLRGVPALHGMVGRDSMLMEFVEGEGTLTDSRELRPEQYPPPDFFRRLAALVQALHDRGVCHGDMRRRNILLGRDGTPYLIDFATAVSLDGPGGLLRRTVHRLLRRSDQFAVAKIIHSYYPGLLTEEEKRRLTQVPWPLRAGRFLRKRVYRHFIKQRRWQERWCRWTAAPKGAVPNHGGPQP